MDFVRKEARIHGNCLWLGASSNDAGKTNNRDSSGVNYTIIGAY